MSAIQRFGWFQNVTFLLGKIAGGLPRGFGFAVPLLNATVHNPPVDPAPKLKMKELTPKEIVKALDKHIVGQNNAKRAAAVAIRNRWRRQQLPDRMREEVGPANMILIGPTGVGKTEIARRIAGLVNAPFLKVEATKYTEVGYPGRAVESMVRALGEVAVHSVRARPTQVADRGYHGREPARAAGSVCQPRVP